jgi:hypothetical protein
VLCPDCSWITSITAFNPRFSGIYGSVADDPGIILMPGPFAPPKEVAARNPSVRSLTAGLWEAPAINSATLQQHDYNSIKRHD